MKTAEFEGVAPQKRKITRVLQVMSASILVLAAAGCRSHEEFSIVKGHVIADPSQRHPIRVSQKDRHTDFVVQRGDYGLDKAEKAQLRSIIRHYKTDGVGKIFVKAPAGAPNEVAVRRALGDFRRVMKGENIPVQAVSFDTFVPNGDPEAPITVSYRRYVAEGPECGIWDENLAHPRKNLPYSNFGCAQQRNLAAMVASPKDLVEPRDMGQRAGERRDELWKAFIAGNSTATAESSDQNAGVSDAGSQGE